MTTRTDRPSSPASRSSPRKEIGTVSRIVPGRLVYVDVPASGGTFTVTPDKFALVQVNGKTARYKGEPFADIGINIGTKVQVIQDGEHLQQVVVKRGRSRNLVSRFLKHPA